MMLLSCNSGPDNHTVSFSLNGGQFPEGYETTITVPDGNTLEDIPEPEKESTYSYRYTFAGWYTDEALTTEYDMSLPVTGSMTLYAKWNRYAISHTKRYTVSFQSNGGTEVASQSVVSGNMAEKPEEPEKEGYSFDGWYSDENTSVLYDFDAPVTSSITLYAKWAKAWTVTFSIDDLNKYEVFKGIAIEKDTLYVKDGNKITFPEITIGEDPLSNIKFKDTSTGLGFDSDSSISKDLSLAAFIDDYVIAGNTYYVSSAEGLMAWAMAVNTTGIDYNCVQLEDISL